MRKILFIIAMCISFVPIYVLGQGNLPSEFTYIEFDGGLIYDDETIVVCSEQGGEFNLIMSANYLPAGNTATNDYEIYPIPFTTIYPLNPPPGSTDFISLTQDDFFSDIQTLPFDFYFFGSQNNQLVVGANGRIVFNPELAGQADAWSISDQEELEGLPVLDGFSADSGGGQIFGVYQDTNPNDNDAVPPSSGEPGSNFNFGVYGDAPFRAFVVNFYKIPLFGGGCDSYNSDDGPDEILQTYQMILHEGTNYIDIIVHKRDSCPGWNSGRGVIGIQSGDNGIAYTPEGRDIGTWNATQEAWRIAPVGNVNDTTEIEWLFNDELISEDTTINEIITEDTNVTLNVKYKIGNTNEYAVYPINVFIDLVSVDVPESLALCEGNSATITATSEDATVFTWYKDNEVIEGETGSEISVSEAGIYRVEIEGDNCTASDATIVQVNDIEELLIATDSSCEDGNNQSTIEDLHSYREDLINEDINGYTFAYYPTYEDAENQTNEILNTQNYVVNVGLNTIYVLVTNTNTGCKGITEIQYTVYDNPEITSIDVNETTITINASGGDQPYEYSIDGVNWQSSNQFSGLTEENTTAYVRSVHGCIGMGTYEIIIIYEIDVVPNVVTPNGDGVNDTWIISGMAQFPGSKITIFDRYGKLIQEITTTTNDEVWDCKYLKDNLPSTTYWYTLEVTNGQKFEGYLVIKNRFKK